MKIGILSDTHSFLHPSIPDMLKGCDLILHAGDVGDLKILDTLSEIAPLKAVWGNIDGAEMRRLVPEHQRFMVEGCRIWMTHIGGHPKKWDKRVAETLKQERPDIFICGHSHILRIERVAELGNMLFLNPGACGNHGWHKVKTCVRLTIENGKAMQAEVIEL